MLPWERPEQASAVAALLWRGPQRCCRGEAAGGTSRCWWPRHLQAADRVSGRGL